MQDSNEHQIRIINGGPGLISLALGNAYVSQPNGCATRYFKEPRGAGDQENTFL